VVRRELRREFDLEVSLRTIERAVAPLRRQIHASAVTTVRFEMPPGKQMQADFGQTSVLHLLGFSLVIGIKARYIRSMLLLSSIGEQIATRRKASGLTQTALAKKARVGRSTLDALENGRMGELGYSKVSNILSALGLELKLQETSTRRPTLDELMEEERDDKGLDRRR
jgi:predicted XRE-type DNA-binding protein